MLSFREIKKDQYNEEFFLESFLEGFKKAELKLDYFKKIPEDVFSKENGVILTAFDDQKMVAFLSCYIVKRHLRSPHLFIDLMFVCDDYRQKSLGTILLIKAMELGQKLGADHIRLSSFEESEGFYQKLGFNKVYNDKLTYSYTISGSNISSLLSKIKDSNLYRNEK